MNRYPFGTGCPAALRRASGIKASVASYLASKLAFVRGAFRQVTVYQASKQVLNADAVL
jgi:hypothetical protein